LTFCFKAEIIIFVATRADSEGQVGQKTEGDSGITLMVTAKTRRVFAIIIEDEEMKRTTQTTVGDQ
jgi:hypothetical protein